MNFKHQISETELDALLQQRIRLFMSVDVSGSTALKHQSSVADSGGWLSFFTAFYIGFPQLLIQATQDFLKANSTHLLVPHLWKALGDELVFVIELDHPEQTEQYLTIFRSALAKAVTHHRYGHNPLPIHFKTYAWIADFPQGNIAIPTTQDEVGSSFDFVGPSMDIGFRLGSLATPRQFTISVELAFLVLSSKSSHANFYFDGKTPLNGVLNGKGYPVIWIDNFQDLPDSHLHQEHTLIRAEDQLTGRQPVDLGDLQHFCEEYIKEMGQPLTLPGFDKIEDTQSVEQRLRNIFTVIKERMPDNIDLSDEPIPELENWQAPPINHQLSQ